MSALQDILDKMYVEEELLAQLDEEQKHILFIKMREEQVRRWKQREAEQEERERQNNVVRQGRRVQWLKGRDGEVWTWVMGDHPDDPSIDEIIEDETRKKARVLAEAEILMESLQEDHPPSSSAISEEQHLKDQLRRMRLGTSSEESNDASSKSDPIQEQPVVQKVESWNPKSTARFINASASTASNNNNNSSNQPPFYAQIHRNPAPPPPVDQDLPKRYFDNDQRRNEEDLKRYADPSEFKKNIDPLEQRRIEADSRWNFDKPVDVPSVKRYHQDAVEQKRGHVKQNGTSDVRRPNDVEPKRNGIELENGRRLILAEGPDADRFLNETEGRKLSNGRTTPDYLYKQPRIPVELPRRQPDQFSYNPGDYRELIDDKQPSSSAQNGAQHVDNVGQQQVGKQTHPSWLRKTPNHLNSTEPNRSMMNGNGTAANLIKAYNSLAQKSGSDESRKSSDEEGAQPRRQSNGAPPPIPARPAHLAKKNKNEKEFVQTTRSYVPGISPKTTVTRFGPQPFPVSPESSPEVEAPQRSSISSSSEADRLREAQAKFDELQVPQDEIDKRQSRILEKLMEEHQRLKVEAEREAEKQRLDYEEQERKAREAEAQIRSIAQRAREQHQNSLRTSTTLVPLLNNPNATSFRDAVKSCRPVKPQNRQAIVTWFKQVELPNGTGIDPRTQQPYIWFHGILSRPLADSLLANQPPGAFIVRVSERIWGYTVSYVVGGSKLKHFLVEKIPEGYQFLGTNQVVHESLQALVNYHETKPITSRGHEVLLYPVGQLNNYSPPDYSDLFESIPMKQHKTPNFFPASASLLNGITQR